MAYTDRRPLYPERWLELSLCERVLILASLVTEMRSSGDPLLVARAAPDNRWRMIELEDPGIRLDVQELQREAELPEYPPLATAPPLTTRPPVFLVSRGGVFMPRIHPDQAERWLEDDPEVLALFERLGCIVELPRPPLFLAGHELGAPGEGAP